MNKGTLNVTTQVFMWTLALTSLGCFPRSRLAEAQSRYVTQFSKVVVTFTLSSVIYECPELHSNSGEYVVVTHCGLNMYL